MKLRLISKTRSFSKLGQVTIFIIVGLVIFFVFLGLLMLSSSLQKQQLTKAKEGIYSGIFTKEALRIYVDKCLQEGMEQGLTLLGKQGRIWRDQFGGREQFVEEVTGVTVGADRVFYGLADNSIEKYPSQQLNAYPCPTDDNNPAFCRYQYPNTTIGFGALKLDRRFIQADLERYLTSYAVACVERLVRSEIKDVAKVETSADVDFKAVLNPGVITVRVNYPLRLRAGKDEFFHISQFDFTYPSDFDQLLTAAVLFPLRNDQKYLEFDFSEPTLLQPTFRYKSKTDAQDVNAPNYVPNPYCEPDGTCQQTTRSAQHAALGLRMEKVPLANGDDLYQFTLPRSRIIFSSGGEYTYQFVRQNRPPALDYIERKACPAAGYDYLVVQGDSELGTIELEASAQDPDEEGATPFFEKPTGFPVYEPPPTPLSGYVIGKFFLGVQTVLGIPAQPEPYIFRVKAADQHGKKDYQDVRIFVDQPLIANIKIRSPYNPNPNVGAPKVDGKYVLSREDPYFMDLEYSASSKVTNRERGVELRYASESGKSFGYTIPVGQNNNCFAFPIEEGEDRKNCDLNQYIAIIREWGFERQLQSPENPFAPEFGAYTLRATADYCEKPAAVSSNEVKVAVAPCYPFRNSEHPYAYPNEKKTFGLNQYGSTDFNVPKPDESINPFSATHACCFGDVNYPNGDPVNSITADPFVKENFNKGEWRLAPAGTECYEDPKPGCYGRIEGFTTLNQNFRGYIVETLKQTCDGRRGNICGGGREAVLYSNELRCGNKNQLNSCDKVADGCEDILAWGYSQNGWCNGQMGCQEFSTKEVVVDDSVTLSLNNLYEMNKLAKDTKSIFSNNDLKVHAGCTLPDIEKKCDKNFDGKFKGTCKKQNGGRQNEFYCDGDTE